VELVVPLNTQRQTRCRRAIERLVGRIVSLTDCVHCIGRSSVDSAVDKLTHGYLFLDYVHDTTESVTECTLHL